MANGHGGRRRGAGRKPDDGAMRLRRLARGLCLEKIQEMARLVDEAKSETVRTTAFDRLFKVGFGRELRDIVVDDDEMQPQKDVVVWPSDPSRAIPDPARKNLG